MVYRWLKLTIRRRTFNNNTECPDIHILSIFMIPLVLNDVDPNNSSPDDIYQDKATLSVRPPIVANRMVLQHLSAYL